MAYIDENCKIIGAGAFSDRSSLTKVVIPNSVVYIGAVAFTGCSSLTKVVIPNSVAYIGDIAFSSCSSLTEIIIPNSVTIIGGRVFGYCTGLKIYCEVESKPNGWYEEWAEAWNDSNCTVIWGYKG